MPKLEKSIKKVAMVIRPKPGRDAAEADLVRTFLEQNGLSVLLARTDSEELKERLNKSEFDMVIALGGDGTMLRAGHLTAPLGLPVLGINLGRFGFLMQLTKTDWKERLPRLISGDYKIENRMMLQADHWRGDQLLGTFQVINEVVVCRGQVVRPIRIHAQVDGQRLASYVADGLIAATPTGSTAYALAVDGPIMPPELRNILIVPVAAHLSMSQAVILHEGACVEFCPTSDHQTVMSVDGHPPEHMKNGDVVAIKASEFQFKFVVFQEPGYFYRNLSHYMEQNPSIGVRND
jgi:NAD+ kinase